MEKPVRNPLEGMHRIAMSSRCLCTPGILGGLALRRTALTCLTALALELGLIAGAQAAGASYVYDELDRLIKVIAPDGTGTPYTKEPAGNILAGRADAPTAPAITAFYSVTDESGS